MHTRTGRIRASINSRQETGNLDIDTWEGKGQVRLEFSIHIKISRAFAWIESQSCRHNCPQVLGWNIPRIPPRSAGNSPPQRHAALFRSLEKSHCHSLFARTRRRGPWILAWLDVMTPRADDGSHKRLPSKTKPLDPIVAGEWPRRCDQPYHTQRPPPGRGEAAEAHLSPCMSFPPCGLGGSDH